MIKDKKIKVDDKNYDCLKNTLDNFDKTKFYTTKTFKRIYYYCITYLNTGSINASYY